MPRPEGYVDTLGSVPFDQRQCLTPPENPIQSSSVSMNIEMHEEAGPNEHMSSNEVDVNNHDTFNETELNARDASSLS